MAKATREEWAKRASPVHEDADCAAGGKTQDGDHHARDRVAFTNFIAPAIAP